MKFIAMTTEELNAASTKYDWQITETTPHGGWEVIYIGSKADCQKHADDLNANKGDKRVYYSVEKVERD